MEWWVGGCVALVLLGLETMTGGFFIFFFAISAGIIALLLILSLDLSIEVQLWTFGILSIIGMGVFRKYLIGKGARIDIDSLIGTSAEALSEIPPGEHGKVESRGSIWEAKNVGSETIYKRCTVSGLEGLKLLVKK
jgi:membrane protein implicated in regulation of membrane protease activity